MVRTVAPLQVSPLIKAIFKNGACFKENETGAYFYYHAGRWGLLIFGVIYGNMKLHSLRVFEKTQHKIRERLIEEKHARIKRESKEKSAEELMDLGKQLEVTEFPPGWDDSL